MHWLRSITREIFGLFVDNGSFAVAILVWLAVAAFLLPRFAPGATWAGPLLFAGLAIILIESVWRYSRRDDK